MVCNKHFMHGCLAQEYSDPNLLMGHDKIKSKSARRVLCKIEPLCQNYASSSDIHTHRNVEVQTDMKVISDICVQIS
ncbi:hypothetical protein ACJMK2_013491 [Sinanodonta woodiana]|uniref:THAP-type domain-containing protein n=1 Tax=Sinanodonta woodiana TaxID=1069815 RepID=A0ABD3UXP0_SINWO